MTLSIAMTTYNGERYLREQLDSILLQTVQDWELIVCDDCSTDSTWQILKEYASRDSRIRIFLNETNFGFVKNFEKAISLSSGDYIALSDQDDIWEQNHLEVLLKNIQGNSAAVGNGHIIDGPGMLADHLLSDGDKFYHSGDDIDKLFTILCYRNPFSGAISLFTRDLINVALPIPDFVKFHDVWLASLSCCMKGLNYSYMPLLKHRIHGKNESGNHNITLSHQIKSIFSKNRKSFHISRIKICDALLERCSEASDTIKESILLIKSYHEYLLQGKKLKAISFMRTFYKKIYSTNNYNQFFSRCLRALIVG